METALLFLIFNRPDTTKVVFEKIKAAQPRRLYIAADGPRPSHSLDEILCTQTRSIVTQIDWPCEVKHLYQDKNLGCKSAVSIALDWFFENEEEGIVLEDDIVPAKEFFGFCELMLKKYREDFQVMMVSGFNPLGAKVASSEYFFSENPSIWGWATWRNRWKLYDKDMVLWSEKSYHRKYKNTLPIFVLEQYIESYEKTKKGSINTWDYQWTHSIQHHNGLTVKPLANLISNIGVSGTHAIAQDENHFVPYGILDLNLLHGPKKIIANSQQDILFYKRAFKKERLALQFKYLLRVLGLFPLIKKLFQK